jgi:hypothetical protein
MESQPPRRGSNESEAPGRPISAATNLYLWLIQE